MKGSSSKAMGFLNKILTDYKGAGISYIEFDIELEAYLKK